MVEVSYLKLFLVIIRVLWLTGRLPSEANTPTLSGEISFITAWHFGLAS